MFLLIFPLISNFEVEASHNANLYVSAENSKFGNLFSGSMVIEVVINDLNIRDKQPIMAVPVCVTSQQEAELVLVSSQSPAEWLISLLD